MSKKTDSSEIEEMTDATPQIAAVPKEEVTKENVEVKPVVTPVKAKAKPKRYGLERFLQLYPQSSYVEAILRMLYPNEVMTAAEWLNLIETILLNKPRAKAISRG